MNPSGTEPLIRVSGLNKQYGGFALKDVSITVEPGEIVGFVGANGAGKTTTIKSILGLVPPDSGDGQILGVPIRDMGGPAGVAVKERVGTVFDAVGLPLSMRVRDAAAVLPRCFEHWNAPLFDRLLGKAGIAPDRTVAELSRGMGMKLSLAIALSHNPRLLILDEATAGLDPMARDGILDTLRGFVSAGEDGGGPRGILMSSHITDDLERIADRVVCIDAGRIVFDRPKDEITDLMGIARCRAADVATIRGSGAYDPGSLRMIRGQYGTDVAVPDRFAFAEAFPDIPCDRMTIDDCMRFELKGERL